MKVRYFNDTNSELVVSYLKPSSTWEREYISVKPQTFIEICLNVPEGHGIFFKEWDDGEVFISTYDTI